MSDVHKAFNNWLTEGRFSSMLALKGGTRNALFIAFNCGWDLRFKWSGWVKEQNKRENFLESWPAL